MAPRRASAQHESARIERELPTQQGEGQPRKLSSDHDVSSGARETAVEECLVARFEVSVRARGSLGRTEQQPPILTLAMFGELAFAGMFAGVLGANIEPEISDERVEMREAGTVRGHAAAGDRKQGEHV